MFKGKCVFNKSPIFQNEIVCLYEGKKIGQEKFKELMPTLKEDEINKIFDVEKGFKNKNYFIQPNDKIYPAQYMNHVCKHLSNVKPKVI